MLKALSSPFAMVEIPSRGNAFNASVPEEEVPAFQWALISIRLASDVSRTSTAKGLPWKLSLPTRGGNIEWALISTRCAFQSTETHRI